MWGREICDAFLGEGKGEDCFCLLYVFVEYSNGRKCDTVIALKLAHSFCVYLLERDFDELVQNSIIAAPA